MKYSVNLEKLTIDDYKDFLSRITMIPSRKLLQQNIAANFSNIRTLGVNNLSELSKLLSSPQKLKAFSEKTGLSDDYLVLLKRELGCLEPKPVMLMDFPLEDSAVTETLLQAGIKTSKDCYELVEFSDSIGNINNVCSIPGDEAYELFCLCGLSRINGIGAAAAKCFFDAGYRSASDVANSDAEEMLKKVSAANEGSRYYKAKLGLKDMQFCIDYAAILLRISD